MTGITELQSLLFFALFINNYYYINYKEKYKQTKLHK